MKQTIDKILAAMGNIRAMERLHVDNHTEDIIDSIEEIPFAESEQNKIYLATKELGGFFYLKTIVVGSFKIKTIKGAKLLVTGSDFEFELKTDMDEFESDFSNVSNRSITRIDFQLDEENVDYFYKEKIKTLTLKAKKHNIVFKTT